MGVCNVERLILQAIYDLGNDPLLIEIGDSISAFRKREMSKALMESALHGMNKNGLVRIWEIKGQDQRYTITELGKKELASL